MTGSRPGRGDCRIKRARAPAVTSKSTKGRFRAFAPFVPAPSFGKKISWPSVVWRSESQSITRPCRVIASGKWKRKALPWRLPKPLSMDEQMWADYVAFKAAGLLHVWLELYRRVLNLKPSQMQAVP